MALIPPSYLDCAVAIGIPGSAGTQYVATGFLYGRYAPGENAGQDGSYTVFLATNRHVLKDVSTIMLRFNSGPGKPAREFQAVLEPNGGRTWFNHPKDDIDVAVVLLNAALLQQEQIPITLFRDNVDVLFHSDPAAQHMHEGDGVYIIGFPMGLIGAHRNYAIVRGGCVARIRDSLAGTASTFLVDSFIFPGNSGGPVVAKPEVMSITGTQALGSAKLIGIVTGYLPYRDVAVSQQTQRPRIIFEENSGLAQVLPVDRVREAVEHAVAILK